MSRARVPWIRWLGPRDGVRRSYAVRALNPVETPYLASVGERPGPRFNIQERLPRQAATGSGSLWCLPDHPSLLFVNQQVMREENGAGEIILVTVPPVRFGCG